MRRSCRGLLANPRAPGDPFRSHNCAGNQQPQRARSGAAKPLGQDAPGDRPARRLPDFADVPGGTTGLLCKDYKGKVADTVVYKVDTGLLAELRGHERQAAEELGQWKTRVEERKVIDASPAAMTLAAIFTTAELGSWRRRRGTG